MAVITTWPPLGEEVIHQLPAGHPQLFSVGLVDVLPKFIAHLILQPALQMPDSVRMICREASIDTLLAELAGSMK
ncbi:MAG: hypothetical protein PVI92_16585 [Chromatiales bacterium]|jgi:LysR family transcriptional activator of nhaA